MIPINFDIKKKYNLNNNYAYVMDLLNQIVHNDDGNYNKYNTDYLSENKFNDFLTNSNLLNDILKDIINEIESFFTYVKKKNTSRPNI